MYLDPASEYILFDSATRRFFMDVAGVEGKFFIQLSLFDEVFIDHIWQCRYVKVIITCVRRANENAINLIAVVQFLISRNIFTGSSSQELN